MGRFQAAPGAQAGSGWRYRSECHYIGGERDGQSSLGRRRPSAVLGTPANREDRPKHRRDESRQAGGENIARYRGRSGRRRRALRAFRPAPQTTSSKCRPLDARRVVRRRPMRIALDTNVLADAEGANGSIMRDQALTPIQRAPRARSFYRLRRWANCSMCWCERSTGARHVLGKPC